VSASWYPDKEAASRVPTWNYAAAELRGQLQRFDETDELAQLVSDIGDRFEASVGQAWQFEPQRDDHRRQLRGIIGFRFTVEQVQLKLKLSQNHPEANQQAVIAELEKLDTPHFTELAQWMRWHRAQTAASD
jgi:transcriptional regulator